MRVIRKSRTPITAPNNAFPARPGSSRMRSTRLSEPHSGCNTARPHARDSGSLPVADALEAIRQIVFACIDPETLVGSRRLIDRVHPTFPIQKSAALIPIALPKRQSSLRQMQNRPAELVDRLVEGLGLGPLRGC